MTPVLACAGSQQLRHALFKKELPLSVRPEKVDRQCFWGSGTVLAFRASGLGVQLTVHGAHASVRQWLEKPEVPTIKIDQTLLQAETTKALNHHLGVSEATGRLFGVLTIRASYYLGSFLVDPAIHKPPPPPPRIAMKRQGRLL